MKAYEAIERVNKCKELYSKLTQVNNKIYDDNEFAKVLATTGVYKETLQDIQHMLNSYKELLEKELKQTDLNL